MSGRLPSLDLQRGELQHVPLWRLQGDSKQLPDCRGLSGYVSQVCATSLSRELGQMPSKYDRKAPTTCTLSYFMFDWIVKLELSRIF